MKTPASLFVALTCCFLIAGTARSQTGDDNPTGVSGQFNGNVTTAGSYDPYTGNATRAITDMITPGAVGMYPLAFTRTMNTRALTGAGRTFEFGHGGNWRHNYQWEIMPQTVFDDMRGNQVLPPSYLVTYPDGRRANFFPDTQNSPRDPYFRSSPGIRDRFEQLSEANDDECHLLLPDGGKVTFSVTITRYGGGWDWSIDSAVADATSETTAIGGIDPIVVEPPAPIGGTYTTYEFHLKAITDPHGNSLTINQFTEDGALRMTITEPAGRYLKVTYDTSAGTRFVTELEEFRGDQNRVRRCVRYDYTTSHGETVLWRVRYFYEDVFSAHYTYQASNNSYQNTWPLIKTADDPMYGGAMTRIQYDFLPRAEGGAYGQLRSERYPDGSAAGLPVSELRVTGQYTREEKRGDSPVRSFTYAAGGFLKTWKDYRGNEASQEHTNGYVSSSTDERQNKTDFERHPWTGGIKSVTHPRTVSDENEPTPTARTIYGGEPECHDQGNSDTSRPYYPCVVVDERGNRTKYTRDPHTKRVTKIEYEDAAWEEFVYNGFGQVTRHRRRNGAYEHMQYDGRGRLLHAWNPVDSPNEPAGNEPKTTYAYYDDEADAWRDMVRSVTDPRGHTTDYEYDRRPHDDFPYAGRGQVTKIIHPLTPPDTVRYSVSFKYDARGNMKAGTNETGERVEYEHDDYNRATHVKTPLPDGGQAVTFADYRPTNYSQALNEPGSEYRHTSAAARLFRSATGIETNNTYDENLRLRFASTGDGTEAPPTVEYNYDASGNQDYAKDPLGNETRAVFDQRNRIENATGPAPFNYVTQWRYDAASNLVRLIQPDSAEQVTYEQVMKYDKMNRTETYTDPDQHTTTYSYWPSGMLRTLIDPKNQLTSFEYNNRDLREKMTYPNGTQSQGWIYDGAGNLKERRTVGGPVQFFNYDARNRQREMRWNDGRDWSDYDYDGANRLKYAHNWRSTVWRGYDAGGRLEWEQQHMPAPSPTPEPTPIDPEGEPGPSEVVIYPTPKPRYVTATVRYGYDDDGKRTSLGVDGTDYQWRFEYDPHGRFEEIFKGSATSPAHQYYYDKASNLRERRHHANGTTQTFLPDEVNRLKELTVNGPGSQILRQVYSYNAMSRLRTVAPDVGQQNIVYEYKKAGELWRATYGTYATTYNLDEVGNRYSVDENGTYKGYTPNVLNQYEQAESMPVGNGSQHEIATHNDTRYSYIHDTYLWHVSRKNPPRIGDELQGTAYAESTYDTYGLAYDALGRCVERTVNGAPSYYVYDGAHPILEFGWLRTNGDISPAAAVGPTATTDASSWYIGEPPPEEWVFVSVGRNLYGPGIDEVLARDDHLTGQKYYYHHNWQGSVTHVTNASGAVAEQYHYDAFGTPTIGAGNGAWRAETGIGNRFMFTGREWAPKNLGFYEYRTRAYHPRLGRFMSEDPLGHAAGDTNLFRYCGGDPVNFADPFGLQGGGRYGWNYEDTGSTNTSISGTISLGSGRGPSSNGGTGGWGGRTGGGGFGGTSTGVDFAGFAIGGGTGGGDSGGGITAGGVDQSAAVESGFDLTRHYPSGAGFTRLGISGAVTEVVPFSATGIRDATGDLLNLNLPKVAAGVALTGVRAAFRAGATRAAVFWSGGRHAENAARSFANANGGTVLGDTAAGRALASSTTGVPWSQARTQWLPLSEDFARSASGEVHVFQSTRLSLDAIWRNEYQILMSNPNVTKIHFHVVMPNGSIIPVP